MKQNFSDNMLNQLQCHFHNNLMGEIDPQLIGAVTTESMKIFAENWEKIYSQIVTTAKKRIAKNLLVAPEENVDPIEKARLICVR